MRKTKVDTIISNFVKLTKPEVKELCDRLAKEHSVWISVQVPSYKLGGTHTEGFLLKEAE